MLLACWFQIPNHVAIKIALELKKLLTDNSLLDVYVAPLFFSTGVLIQISFIKGFSLFLFCSSQSDLEANLFKVCQTFGSILSIIHPVAVSTFLFLFYWLMLLVSLLVFISGRDSNPRPLPPPFSLQSPSQPYNSLMSGSTPGENFNWTSIISFSVCELVVNIKILWTNNTWRVKGCSSICMPYVLYSTQIFSPWYLFI